MRRPLAALLAAAAVVAVAPAARADFFPATALAGPSPDVVAFGDVDLARDGDGGLVYLEREAGVAHVFLARLRHGAWQAPERVDVALPGAAALPVVAAGEGGRLAIAFVSDGRLYATSTREADPRGPLAAPTMLHAALLGAVRPPAIDFAINGTAYVAYAAPGGGGADVRAARLDGETWSSVPEPLDVDPARAAGSGAGRPRVAVSADGNALVTWGEDVDAAPRVFARRVLGLRLSSAPRQVSVADGAGAPAGAADAPDLDVEDDGSFAWVVWRQTMGGAARALARRLVGSDFETVAAVDGLGKGAGEGVLEPRIAMDGRGQGLAVAARQVTRAVMGSRLEDDVFGPPFPVTAWGGEDDLQTAVAASERDDALVAWRRAQGDTATVRARYAEDGGPLGPERELSVPEWGAVGRGIDAATDRAGNTVIGWAQGGVTGRIAVAVWDRPPTRSFGLNSARWRRARRPTLKWKPSFDAWGPVQYEVVLDGESIGRTRARFLRLPRPLPDGHHRWSVVAVDQRGQRAPSRAFRLRIDARPPRSVRIAVPDRARAGRAVTVALRVDDGGGSGAHRVRVDYGDGSPRGRGVRTRHRYRKPGRYVIRARVRDATAHVVRARRTVVVRP